MTAASLVYLAACGALVYSGFCRLVHTSDTTLVIVRAVIWLLTAAALAAGGAVLFWSHVPRWPDAALAAAIAAVQVVTAVLWRDGVPASFRRQA